MLENVTSRICTRCGFDKDLSCFSPSKLGRFGRRSKCRSCCVRDTRQRQLADPDHLRRHRESENRRVAKRSEAEKQAKLIYNKQYYEANREKLIRSACRGVMHRRATDLNCYISGNLRSRLYRALKKGWKNGSAVRDLGCSISEFRTHLESKFQEGMSWDNYGKGSDKWNIDHIMPFSAFDLSNRQHLLLACNYLNLQPLWETENISKGGAKRRKLNCQ